MSNPNFPAPPARTFSWQQEVLYADPEWQRGYTRPIIYEFSNGRTFVAPVPLYGPGNTGPSGNYLTSDSGAVLTDDAGNPLIPA